jgi:septum site-determining protein MinD
MAGYVCTIAGGKGGVGKTTTAVNVGAALEERGYDTAVVDADLGMANLGAMLGVEYDNSLHEILAGNATVSEGLTDAQGGVTVIPGEQSLEAFAEADPAKLRKVIKTLRNSHETTVPLGLADGILLVTTPDDVAVADTVKTAELAGRVDGEILGGIVCRVTRNTDVESIVERFEFPTLGVIPVDLDATENEPLVLNSPDSEAADAYRQLTAVLEGVFFEGAAAGDAELVLDEDWFVDEDEAVDEEESSGGRFGFFG